jgi:Lysylphosphatidylglycerol synthase TM region
VGLFVGILPGPSNPLLSILPAAVSAAVLAFFLALPRMLERGAGHEAPGRVRFVLNTIDESVRDTRRLLLRRDWRILGAIGFLWFDIGVLVACFAAEGVHPPLASIVLAYQIAYISNLIPVPGGIGVLDGSFIGLLVLYGVSATSAAAATLVYHAIALWIPAMWGTVAFLVLRHNRNEPLVLRPPRNAPRGAGSGPGEVLSPGDGRERSEVNSGGDGIERSEVNSGGDGSEVHSGRAETGSSRGFAPPAD